MSAHERREIQIFLHQLKRSTPAWKKSASKKIDAVPAGKFATIGELEARDRRA